MVCGSATSVKWCTVMPDRRSSPTVSSKYVESTTVIGTRSSPGWSCRTCSTAATVRRRHTRRSWKSKVRRHAGIALRSIPPMASGSRVIASGRTDASFRATVVLPAPKAPFSQTTCRCGCVVPDTVAMVLARGNFA